jgi:hypothetical protein
LRRTFFCLLGIILFAAGFYSSSSAISSFHPSSPRGAYFFLIISTMASIEIFPGLKVVIVSVDAQGGLTPMHSSLTGLGNPDETHHSLEVRDGTRFGILLTFDLSTRRSFHHVDYVNLDLRFDRRDVAHHQIPMPDIVKNGGNFAITTFTDRTIPSVKTAELRALTTGMMH